MKSYQFRLIEYSFFPCSIFFCT